MLFPITSKYASVAPFTYEAAYTILLQEITLKSYLARHGKRCRCLRPERLGGAHVPVALSMAQRAWSIYIHAKLSTWNPK